ncbi:hypothetical protein [Sorangium cellulosum]|uniref:hypothetical protein n=1 Tax=Sorangium cellulosum TaxID=56 RepID=UPI001331938C|nr:hypothetical protein [Sorangium cellulosum]
MLKRLSIDKLTTLLALPATGQEQDWELELANENRIGEFLMAYEGLALSPDDKFALMALILASADRYVDATARIPGGWKKIADILIDERGLHQETISYWMCIDEDDPQDWFCLTPHVRALSASR